MSSHEHREWIPIVDNDQDMPRLAQRVGALLERAAGRPRLLLRRHGLYTWGDTLADAERHVEILEFLFETVGLNLQLGNHASGNGSRNSIGLHHGARRVDIDF